MVRFIVGCVIKMGLVRAHTNLHGNVLFGIIFRKTNQLRTLPHIQENLDARIIAIPLLSGSRYSSLLCRSTACGAPRFHPHVYPQTHSQGWSADRGQFPRSPRPTADRSCGAGHFVRRPLPSPLCLRMAPIPFPHNASQSRPTAGLPAPGGVG